MSLQIFDGLYEEGEYVDLRSNQTIRGIKTFIDDLVSLAGAHGMTIRPFVGQGESSLRLQRMSDGSEPQHGDTWVVGQGAWGSARCLVFGFHGVAGTRVKNHGFP